MLLLTPSRSVTTKKKSNRGDKPTSMKITIKLTQYYIFTSLSVFHLRTLLKHCLAELAKLSTNTKQQTSIKVNLSIDEERTLEMNKLGTNIEMNCAWNEINTSQIASN